MLIKIRVWLVYLIHFSHELPLSSAYLSSACSPLRLFTALSSPSLPALLSISPSALLPFSQSHLCSSGISYYSPAISFHPVPLYLKGYFIICEEPTVNVCYEQANKQGDCNNICLLLTREKKNNTKVTKTTKTPFF